jgi:hypothetical protein
MPLLFTKRVRRVLVAHWLECMLFTTCFNFKNLARGAAAWCGRTPALIRSWYMHAATEVLCASLPVHRLCAPATFVILYHDDYCSLACDTPCDCIRAIHKNFTTRSAGHSIHVSARFWVSAVQILGFGCTCGALYYSSGIACLHTYM